MTEKKKKSIKKPKSENSDKTEKAKEQNTTDQDDFDFGGFPQDVSLKRNIGCGG